jgi:predicted DCC family thiol-disulfide oxidoreductase YuxK
VLLLQLFVPKSPYGSWIARKRPDPGGDWRLPGWVWRSWQFLFLGGVIFDLGTQFAGSYRTLADPAIVGWLVLLAFAFDPRWAPPRRGAEPEVAFYDGECGLCHRIVRLCFAEDVDGRSFRFAPLQGPTFVERVPQELRDKIPDSFVVVRGDGTCLIQSSAAAHIMLGLGGYWRIFGHLLFTIPRPLRDFGYALVARSRRFLFAKPEGLCPLVPPHLGKRFLP